MRLTRSLLHPQGVLRRSLPVCILILAWLLFFWRIITPNLADRLSFQQGDFTLQFLAYRQIAYRQIASGHFPVFEECIYSGYPFQADPQSQVLYPPVIGTMMLGKVLGWSDYPLRALEWEVLLHVLLTLVGMYAFLRVMNLHPIAAVFGSLAFGFGGYITGYAILQTAILETAAWLPIILLLLYKLALHPRQTPFRSWFPNVIALAAMIYCCYTAGHPQTLLFTVYTGIAAYIYWSIRNHLSPKLIIVRAGFVALFAISLSAAQLIPSLSFMLASTRSGLPFAVSGTGFALQDIVLFILTGITNVWQPLYIGITALVLAVIAFSNCRSDGRFWFVVAIVALILSFGINGAGFDIAYITAPGYKQFHSQERHALIVVLSLSILAAIGLDTLLHPLRSRSRFRLRRYARATGWFGLIAFSGLTITVLYQRIIQPENAALGIINTRVALLAISLGLTSALLFWRSQLGHTPRLYWALALIVVACFDLFSADRYTATQALSEPFPELKLVQPIQQGNDLPALLRQTGAYRLYNHFGLPLNGACVRGLSEISGGSPIVLQYYRDFLARTPEDIASRLLNVHYTVTWRGGMGTDNGRHIPEQIVASDQYQNISVNTFWLKWSEPGVQPAWIASIITVVADANQLYARLNQADYSASTEAVLYAPDDLRIHQAATGSAALEGKANGYMKIAATTDTPALLVISEAYHWNWVALVNGVEVKPVITNGALLGVPIPEGTSSVEMSYRPTDLYIGSAISLTAMLLLTVCWLVIRWSHHGTTATSLNTPSDRSSQ